MQTVTIGEKIRLHRLLKGFSQKGLAMLTGLKQENISYIESGKSKKQIDTAVLEKICAALQITVNELVQSQITTNQVFENTMNETLGLSTELQNKLGADDKLIAIQQQIIENLVEQNKTLHHLLQHCYSGKPNSDDTNALISKG